MNLFFLIILVSTVNKKIFIWETTFQFCTECVAYKLKALILVIINVSPCNDLVNQLKLLTIKPGVHIY